MPAYSRDSGAWEQAVFRQRVSGEWSGDDALGYVRDGGEWVLFQQPVGDEDLLKPENLTASPGDFDATFTWTNPEPLFEAATPTHIQVRIPNTTTVWTELVYPATTTSIAYLNSSTEYQFQARYIIREDGSITATGAIAEVFFTTTTVDGPGTPAADPGGTGPDTIWDWGPTPGGGSCHWEYILQLADTPASGFLTWSDTAVTGTVASEGQLALDLVNDEGIACGQLARWKFRQNCSGDTSDYEFGEEFVVVCDWGQDCGGVTPSVNFTLAPYTDANTLFAFPQSCPSDTDTMRVEDAVQPSVEYGKLAGFGSIQTYTDGFHTAYGKTTNSTVGTPMLAGVCGDMALLEDADDFSVTMRVMLDEVPGGTGGGGGVAPAAFPIARFGRNVAISAVFDTTTTWVARATWIDANGDFVTLTGTTPLSLDEYHSLTLVLDSNSTKILYVDGAVEESDTSNVACAFSADGIGQDIQVYANGFMRFQGCAGWDRVLSAAEVLGLVNPSPAPYLKDIVATSLASESVLSLSGLDFAANDVVYVLLVQSSSPSLSTPPAGWSTPEYGLQTAGMYLYAKVMTGSETDLTLNVPSSAFCRVNMTSVSNVDPNALFGYYEWSTYNSSVSTLANTTGLSTDQVAFDNITPVTGATFLTLGTFQVVRAITKSDNSGAADHYTADSMELIQDDNGSNTAYALSVESAEEQFDNGVPDRVRITYSTTGPGVTYVSMMLHAPRTSPSPEIVEIYSGATSSSTIAANVTIPPNRQEGELIVFFLNPWVWDVSGTTSATTLDSDATFISNIQDGSTNYIAFYAFYDASHGNTYTLSGSASPSSIYSRYWYAVRIVNAGTPTGAGYEEATSEAIAQTVVRTIAADAGDLVLAHTFGRSDLNGLVFHSNPDSFELATTEGTSVGGAGGSRAVATLIAPTTKTYSGPQFDHQTTSSGFFGTRYFLVVVPPA